MAKQKSLKKTIKNNKKKKLNLKNLDFKKNWKKLTYGGALSLLLFTSISFAGYTYIQQKNLEAQAAGWTYITSINGNGFVKACKSYVNSAYGPLYLVKTQTYSGKGNANGGSIVYREGKFISASYTGNISPYKYGYTSSYSSILLRDHVAVDIRGSLGGSSSMTFFHNGVGPNVTSC